MSQMLFHLRFTTKPTNPIHRVFWTNPHPALIWNSAPLFPLCPPPSHLSPAQSPGPHSTSALGVGAACLPLGMCSPGPGSPGSARGLHCTSHRPARCTPPPLFHPRPSCGCCGRWRRSAVEVETGDGGGRGVIHGGSGIQRRLKTAAAGCCCCFHLLRYFLHCWRTRWCRRCRGGSRDDLSHDDLSRDGGWCHGRCWHGGTGWEMMRQRKGKWRAGSSHLWIPPRDSPTSPSGRPVLGSLCCPGRCSSAYRAGWWWCTRGQAAGCTRHTSAGLPPLRSCAQGTAAMAW